MPSQGIDEANGVVEVLDVDDRGGTVNVVAWHRYDPGRKATARAEPTIPFFASPSQNSITNRPSLYSSSSSTQISPPSRRSQIMSQWIADSFLLPVSG